MYIEFHIVKVLFYSLYYIKQKSLCIWKCIINIFALQRISCFNFILEPTERPCDWSDSYVLAVKTTASCFKLTSFKYILSKWSLETFHKEMRYKTFQRNVEKQKDLALVSS